MRTESSGVVVKRVKILRKRVIIDKQINIIQRVEKFRMSSFLITNM